MNITYNNNGQIILRSTKNYLYENNRKMIEIIQKYSNDTTRNIFIINPLEFFEIIDLVISHFAEF